MKSRILAPLICSLTLASPASASSAVHTHVISVYPQKTENVFFFDVDIAKTGSPTCASQTLRRYAINASTSGGQAMIASILTAFTMQKTIDVYGGNTCQAWSDSEDAELVVVQI